MDVNPGCSLSTWKQDKCIGHVLLQDHVKHLDCVSNARIHVMTSNDHPAPHQHRKLTLGTFSGWQMTNLARDTLSLFQPMAEGDQGDKGQATYSTSRSCHQGIQKNACRCNLLVIRFRPLFLEDVIWWSPALQPNNNKSFCFVLFFVPQRRKGLATEYIIKI